MTTTIERIQFLNLKGKSGEADLTHLTAVIGRNAGGKSAIGQAITIALLGYLPTLGKLPGKTVQLMTSGATTLDIRAKLSDGTQIGRTYNVGKSISSKLTGPDYSDKVIPAQLDFREFVNAKPTDRQRILESLLASSGDGEVFGEAQKRVAMAKLDISLTNAAGWLQQLETEAREVGRFLKQEIDTAARAILTLSAIEAPALFYGDRLTETSAKLAEMRVELGQAKEAFDELARRQQEAPEQPDGERITPMMIAEAEAKVAEIREAMETARAGWQSWSDAKTRAERLLDGHHGSTPVEATSDPMTASELETAQRRFDERARDANARKATAAANARHALAAHQTAEARATELSKSECCPTCGIAGEVLTDAINRILSEQVAEAQKALDVANAEVTAAAEEIAAVEEARFELVQEKVKRRDHDCFLATKESEAIMREADLARPSRTVDAIKVELTAADSHLKRLRLETAQWQAFNAADVPTDEQVEVAGKRWNVAREAVDSLQQVESAQANERDLWNRYLADQERLSDMTKENVDREVRLGEAVELTRWAKAKSLELAAEAMKPLLTVCNVVTCGLNLGELAIDGTAIGVMRGDAFLPLEVLSGSESAAVAAALQVAIAGTSPIRIAMIDELTTFEPERKKQIIDNLFSALKMGLVDQVIVFDHDPQTGLEVGYLNGSTVSIEG
jgi:DNA repair exonuclease SbcCD ATPase subunit